jgi:hypothetical protein
MISNKMIRKPWMKKICKYQSTDFNIITKEKCKLDDWCPICSQGYSHNCIIISETHLYSRNGNTYRVGKYYSNGVVYCEHKYNIDRTRSELVELINKGIFVLMTIKNKNNEYVGLEFDKKELEQCHIDRLNMYCEKSGKTFRF